jgi:hypothetical protein
MIHSMFTVTGQVLKTFIQAGQTDKDTGVIGESSIKVQIMGEMPVKGGDSKFDVISLTVEDEKTYKDLIGKNIRVALGFFAPAKGNIVYFIPKGTKPEMVIS